MQRMIWHPHFVVLVSTCGAEDVGHLSMQVPLLNGVDSQHQAPLADLAEWLSQNLQEDLQGDAMVSSPTHPSRWGPLAPAGIVESKMFVQPCADACVACWQLLRRDSCLVEIGSPTYVFQMTFSRHDATRSTASSNYSGNVHHMHCDTCSSTGSQTQLILTGEVFGKEHKHKPQACCATMTFQICVVLSGYIMAFCNQPSPQLQT